MELLSLKINVNGTNTSLTTRKGEKTAVVFIHGNSLSRNVFTPLFHARDLSSHYLISYDLPGHGESDKPEDPSRTYTMEGYGQHLAGLVKYLKLHRFVLVGFSLGGHIAMQSIAAGLVPEPAGLVTIGSPPLEGPHSFPQAFYPFSGGASLFKNRLTREEAEYIATYLSDSPEKYNDIAKSIIHTDPDARSYLTESLEKNLFHNECRFVSETSIPLLICFGTNEKTVNLNYIRDKKLQEHLGASFMLLRAEPHYPDFSSSGRFLPCLISFLDKIDG